MSSITCTHALHSLVEHDGLECVVVGGEGGDQPLGGELPGHGVGGAAPGLAPGPGLLHQLVTASVPHTRVA